MASIISAGTTSATALNMSADTSGVLQLASNNGTVGLTVTTAQRIGIGTTTPTELVQIRSASSDPYLLIGGDARDCGIKLNATNEFTALRADGANRLFVNAGSEMRFLISDSEKARISSGGSVLVNTTSTYTNTQLNVGGDINATRFHSYYYTATRTGTTTFYFYGNASQGQGNFNYGLFGTGDVFELSISTTGAANEAGCVWTGWTDGDNAWRTMSSYTQGELGSFTFSTGVTSGSGWVAVTWNPYAAGNSCDFYISIRRINRHSN